MVKFIDVDPSEVDNVRQGRRGRVSYPILKGFLETGKYLVQLDTTGMQQSKQSLSSSLTAYIRNHSLPIKMFQRSGKVYLMRLDIDVDGTEIENWQEKALTQHLAQSNAEALPINPEVVEKRFKEEKNKTTK